MLLQQGQQSTDYTVYVLVKAAIFTGAHQILKVKVQVCIRDWSFLAHLSRRLTGELIG